ncbi:MAG: translation elongation factor EF-1 subunit alpha [Candidatus Ranarchaeia archaeon]
MPRDKPHMNLIIIGHIDHGKSTGMGHMLYLAGAVDKRKMDALEKEASEKKDKSWRFAYILDKLKEERERGITIDLAFQKFETDKYDFTIIDAPGHRDFVKNMITGASQADAAILFVSARTGEFEAGISTGGQTREHAYLAYTLGIGQLVVAVNKMDVAEPAWNEKRFNDIKAEMTEFLKKVGYKPDTVIYVPTSGLAGDNVKELSPNMPWFKGEPLLTAINNFKVPPKLTDKPLRLPVENVYSIQGVGTVPVGRVETGIMKKGDNLIFMPSGKEAEVKSIEMHHEMIDQAEPGDNIGFNIRGLERGELRRGEVASHVKTPPPVVSKFVGNVVVLQHPTAIPVGYKPVMHAHTAQVSTSFIELKKKMVPGAGAESKPKFIKSGESAVVVLAPEKPLVLEKFSDIPQLGRFAIRDSGRTVAVGVVQDILETVTKEKEKKPAAKAKAKK